MNIPDDCKYACIKILRFTYSDFLKEKYSQLGKEKQSSISHDFNGTIETIDDLIEGVEIYIELLKINQENLPPRENIDSRLYGRMKRQGAIKSERGQEKINLKWADARLKNHLYWLDEHFESLESLIDSIA